MLTYPRKNGKPLLATYEQFKEVIEPMREKYEPLLKATGAYDEMGQWGVMSFYLWAAMQQQEADGTEVHV